MQLARLIHIKPAQPSPMQIKISVILALLLIYAAGTYLRGAPFLQWQTMLPVYQYQQEYQMGNFDSYYYLLAARAIEQGRYDRIDETRRTPTGAQRPLIPPLSSMLVVWLSDLTGYPVPTLAIFLPVAFGSLLGFVVYPIARSLCMNPTAALCASFLSVFSYSYAYRSQIGIFDTDCLNVVFLYLNTYLAAHALNRQGQFNVPVLFGLVVSTLLFSIWWNTAISIVIFSSLAPFLLNLMVNSKPSDRKKHGMLGLGLIALAAAISYQSLYDLLGLLFGFSDVQFPVIETITELEPVSMDTFSRGTAGNVVLMAMLLLGVGVLVGFKFKQLIFYGIPIFIAFSPLMLGSRFMIFSAPVLAMGGAYLVQWVWDQSGRWARFGSCILLVVLVGSTAFINVPRLTDKPSKPAVHDNIVLLDVLKQYTLPQSNIWTNWSLGYQVNYYLNRGTYADGEISNSGELLYYLSLPFAHTSPRFSANFIKFYTSGHLNVFYQLFDSKFEALDYLKQILSQTLTQAEQTVKQLLVDQILPTSDSFPNASAWMSFFFSSPSQPVYMLLHQRMLQTVSWFKQGNYDFQKGEMDGLPLFLELTQLSKNEGFIYNDQVVVNVEKGLIKHRAGKMHAVQSIVTCDPTRCNTHHYNFNNQQRALALKHQRENDDRFVFMWRSDLKYGAIMSRQMADTTFVQLWMHGNDEQVFELVAADVPHYQLMRVVGEVYEGE